MNSDTISRLPRVYRYVLMMSDVIICLAPRQFFKHLSRAACRITAVAQLYKHTISTNMNMQTSHKAQHIDQYANIHAASNSHCSRSPPHLPSQNLILICS